MGLCSWIVFGFVVGLIARFIMPGQQKLGIIRTTLLGVGGSFMGGFLAALLWGGNWRSPSPAGFIGAIIGAVVLLMISETLFSRRR
ncbi:GlsB/YeaQ/YmgE family stress response membrane protein [Hyalangium rubrum]|uniref:GlsB/YeaQ/YmgE family stress response membrane protein n=1 Tax=Hyalangium rubrum TaxID=3103134 RepID=A0ABU5HA74_9BACT|nr:GlsB/YeaQ/YmgE family stress response membrane protein [Hyalangium sp. s54d21]MDY7230146.1 GlsB/YeaQ/YmgE family stress response membrane protein [Hyalangium sp. s54d21]